MNINNIKDILRLLKPLRNRMHLNTGLFLFFACLTAAGAVATVLAFASLWIPVPHLVRLILYVYAAFAVAGILISAFAVPRTKDLIKTADALGLKERLTTAWQLQDDNSIIAQLQRMDTFKTVSETNFKSLYPIRFPIKLVAALVAFMILTSVSFIIPGHAREIARQTEQLQNVVNEQLKKIEKIEKELVKNEELDEAELEKILEETRRLAKELKDARTEEEALKAVSRTENELKKLDMKKQLNEISEAFSMNDMTRGLGEALKNDSVTDMKQALEQLMQQFDQGEASPEELAEMLKQVSEQISGNEAAEQLQQIAENLTSDNKDSQSVALNDLANMLEQMMQSQGSAGLEQALEQLAQAMQQAKSSISQVDSSLSAGNQHNTGGSAQNSSDGSGQKAALGNGQANSNSAQSGKAGGKSQSAGSGQNGGSGQTSESGNGSGSNQPQGSDETSGSGQGNSGQTPGSGQGGSGQSQGGGSGAGEGSTNEDAGYTGSEGPGGVRKPGKGYEEKYEQLYDPDHLGGDANPSYVSGQKQDGGNSSYSQADHISVQKGAMLPYNEVLTRYSDQAVSYMEETNIPPAMKEIVREYFKSLE
ncbi:MAG TPA: hypothetical protein GXX36_05855 [Clostridiaceae bacterium]|nr:hypothetical protein [Clostridiaceae bacterium]HHV99083.1 hypothetical protein [Clostridiaceae bacterium]